MKKVLVSEGYGAGWATWNDKPKKVAEYLPIIEFIENGGDPSDLDTSDAIVKHEEEIYHPLVQQMIDELGLDGYFYTGGAHGLTVQTVTDAYRIDEYDGSEYLITPQDMW